MKKVGGVLLFSALLLNSAQALELDWSGQFRADAEWFPNYTMDGDHTPPGGRDTAHGYYVPEAGEGKAQFQSLFARLKPRAIVNDNVSIKTEFWLGNPITGFYGDGFPSSTAPNLGNSYYNTTYSGGSSVTAQRFWGEFITDIGVFQVGRAPLNWGLGILYHSGDGLFDRYQSTGDVFRLNAKFGNFSLIPASVKYRKPDGGVVGATTAGAPTGKAEGMSDYMLGLKYENPDEDFEGGLNFIRHIAGGDSEVKWINGQTGSMNYTIWDLYGKKKIGKFDFGIEAPVFNGDLVGVPYKAFALAGELNYAPKESWRLSLRGGRVPGQPNDSAAVDGGPGPQKWKAVYLHPNYHIATIMFNRQLANFSGATGSPGASIFDNPITNANYLALSAQYKADKWKFYGSWAMASADQAAEAGSNFFNTWERTYRANASGKKQEKSYGSEFDFGTELQWDDYTSFGLDLAWYMPGDFYKFSNTATDNPTDSVMAAIFKVGVSF